MLGYPWNACKILSGGVPNFPATNFCEMVIPSPTFISGSEFSFVLRRYRTKSVSEVCRGKSETSSTSHTVGVPFTIQLDRGAYFYVSSLGIQIERVHICEQDAISVADCFCAPVEMVDCHFVTRCRNCFALWNGKKDRCRFILGNSKCRSSATCWHRDDAVANV